MGVINTVIGTPLGYIFRFCMMIVNSYGPAIILFTLITKLLLFPLSLWVQKNSIKMIRIKPALNEIDAEYINDSDRASQLKLDIYHREKYRPLAGIIPMLIQIPIVLGLIQVIYHPMQHLLGIDSGIIEAFLEQAKTVLGTAELGSGAQITAINLIQNPQYTHLFEAVLGGGAEVSAAVEACKSVDFIFLGLDLSSVPKFFSPEWLTVVPWLSGLSAFALSAIQNRINVLQKEASFWEKWGMAIFLTAFSLYFASLVPAGVGLYWICGNIMAVAVLFICNAVMPPKKHIDYEALEKSKEHLANAKKAAAAAKPTAEEKKRARADYRKFTSSGPKQIVFYQERSGYYKYFSRIVKGILERSDYTIHFVTSDPRDELLKNDNPRIVPYYISNNSLITLFMLVDSDVMVTTLPDLDKYHLKRSYVRKDMEYIYVHHGIIGGLNLLRDHALDAYDTVFCGEKNQKKELSEYDAAHGIKGKNLVECGYGVIEDMHEMAEKLVKDRGEGVKPRILIAPSWQPDNILESCLGTILEKLSGKGYEIIIRPHPQYIRRFSGKLEEIKREAAEYLCEDCRFEMDFSSNETVYTADIMITDWSTIAFEYAFSTERPVLFIHTPQKNVNEEMKHKAADSLEIRFRNMIGTDIMPEKLGEELAAAVDGFLSDPEKYRSEICRIRDEYVYNFGRSGEVGAEYIISRVRAAEEKREREYRV